MPNLITLNHMSWKQFLQFIDSFRNFYTEIIIRNSYFDNDIAYQMVSQKEKELLSVIFFLKTL